MNELVIRNILQLVLGYARGMWRQRWYMAVMAWLVCLTGWTMVFFMPYQYQSSASITIDNPQPEITPFLPVKVGDVAAGADAVISRVMNRANLLQVIRNSDLAATIHTPEQLEDAIDMVRSQISLTPSQGNLWVISHRHTQPRVTYQIVKGMLDLIMLQNIDPKTSNQARTAERFLDSQIAEYEAKLAQAEGELREFKKQNAHLLGDEGGGYYLRMKLLVEKLEGEKVKRAELAKRLEHLTRQRETLEQRSSTDEADFGTSSISDIYQQKITALEERRRSLQAKFYIRNGQKLPLYPDDHPDIQEIRRTIEDTRKAAREAERRQAEMKAALPDDKANDPLYLKVNMSLSEVEVELASAEARIQEYEEQLEELRKLEHSLPTLESEHLRLQRRRELLSSKLVSMLSQKGEATFSGDVIESLSKELELKVVGQPYLPRHPVGPNRVLFNTVVLMGGVLAGLVLTLFLAIIRPVFDNPVTLKKELGLPVLGTVSLAMSPSDKPWRHSPLVFLTVMGMLGVCYAGIMFLTIR